MKKRSVLAPKDADVLQSELLRKTEEMRQLKLRMNELQEENKKVKTSANRLERIAKGSSDAGDAGDVLNPRDAARAHSMIEDQKRLLEEKDKKIKALLAGSRMGDIGGRKVGGSPAAVYGIKRPAKKATVMRPASAQPIASPIDRKQLSASVSRSSLTSRGGGSVADASDEVENQENEEPDFQAAPSRARNSLSLRSPSIKRSPSPLTMSRSNSQSTIPAATPSSSGGGGMGNSSMAQNEVKDENHYLDFNKKLQERINQSQRLHREQIGAIGDAPSNSSNESVSLATASAGGGAGRMGSSFFDDDSGFPGNSGGGGGGDGAPGSTEELVWIRRELRQKKAKIAALQNHFEHLTVSFRVEKDLQKITLAQCEELKQTVANLQARERNYQRQLEALEDHRLQLENQGTIITDLQSDKRALEDRIAHLHTNLFQGDTMEALRHKQLLNEHASSITKLSQDLEEKDRAIKALKQTNTGLVEKSQLNEQLLRDKKDLAKENQELRDKCVALTEKLVVFSVDSGVEVEDLERALDIVRRQREEGPSRVSFLNGTEQKEDAALDTVPSLRRKVADLELKARDYILEIQQKTDMLNVQYTINKELKKKQLEDKRKISNFQIEVERLKYELTHRPAVIDDLSESIFALSEDGSEAGLAADQLTGLENIIAFRVMSASFKPNCGYFEGDVASPLTFLTADFYEFETSFSEVFGGFNPQYKFTTQYQVDSDQFLIQYLENEELVLTLYQQLQGTNYKKLAVCYIPLRGLLAPTAAIEGRAQLLHTESVLNATAAAGGVRGSLRDGDDADMEKKMLQTGRHPEAVIGEVHYVLRMKRPILSAPPSESNTPVKARSRQGSISGLPYGTSSSQAQQAFQPSMVSNTLSLHHQNRDVHVPQTALQTGSRATLQASATSSMTNSPALRPAAGPSILSAQPTAAAASSRPPVHAGFSQQSQSQQQVPRSQPPSVNRQQSVGQQLSLDDMNDPFANDPFARTDSPPLAPSQARPPVATAAQVRPSSRTLGTNVAASGSTNLGPTPPGPYSRQSSLAATQPRRWDLDDLSADRRPSLQKEPSVFTVEEPHAESQRSDFSSRTSAQRTAEQEQRDIEELLASPDEQGGLFGNDEETF